MAKFVRGHKAIVLFTLASAMFSGRTRAQGNLECARYQDAMAYNACLARLGPKANDFGSPPAYGERAGAAPDGSERSDEGKAAKVKRRWPRASGNTRRVHMEFPVK